ncbi:MAG TPA: DUF2071 domain-containing protein [Bacteroidia bacterium]|jgi:hypothetical protein|nr:DUF2071 domain-containing protein [Bacteroidia bacterium]
MNIPTLGGLIDRRMLINFSLDKEVLIHYLPSPFRPVLVNGRGIAGICLIRLKHIRPKGFPEGVGIGSENAAHRIAVEWTEDSQVKQGVYIPRRDTSSLLNHWAGGTLFPGIHHLAQFDVAEGNKKYKLSMKSDDGNSLSVEASETEQFPTSSVFRSLEQASAFFKAGAVGFSPNKKNYDGLELRTDIWKVSSLNISRITSSFFENESVFPKGSVVFDNALLMRDIPHTWHNYMGCPGI